MLVPEPPNPRRATNKKVGESGNEGDESDTSSRPTRQQQRDAEKAAREAVNRAQRGDGGGGPTGGENPVRRCWALQAALMQELANEANALRPGAMESISKILGGFMAAVGELAEAAPQRTGYNPRAPTTQSGTAAGGAVRPQFSQMAMAAAATDAPWTVVQRGGWTRGGGDRRPMDCGPAGGWARGRETGC